MSKPSVAIIIPAFNESGGITTCVEKVEEVLQKIKIKSVLLVVNDGSTDNTLEQLTILKRVYKKSLEIVSYSKNKGYGLAIAAGIKTAISKGFTYALIMDSDLTNDPRLIPKFIQKIEEGYDCVKGSRYISGGDATAVPFKRRLPSVLGNKIAAALFQLKIRDYTNGFRIVRLSKLKGMHYKERGFAHILEEVYLLKLKKATFAEIPIKLTTRKKGSSKFRYTIPTFWSYAKYPLMSVYHYGKHS